MGLYFVYQLFLSHPFQIFKRFIFILLVKGDKGFYINMKMEGANDRRKSQDKDSSDVPTSDGLSDSQSRSTSVRDQPSWSSEKLILYFFLSLFLSMIIGPALYKL